MAKATASVKIDLSKFNPALAQYIKYAKRSSDDTMKKVMKGIARFVFSVTPPMDARSETKLDENKRVRWSEGRKLSWKAIDTDTGKSFNIAKNRKKALYDFNRVLAIYKGYRTPSKRVRTRRHDFTIAPGTFQELRKNMKNRTGTTWAGWKLSALVSGIPGWVTKHSWVPGDIQMPTGKNGIYQFIARNMTEWSPAEKIQKRIQWALNMQQRVMENSVRSALVAIGNRTIGKKP